jgi:hypothetical protein
LPFWRRAGESGLAGKKIGRLPAGNQKVMRKRLQKDNFGLRLAAIAFPTFITGIFGLRRTRPDIGKKQNTHRGHQDHDEQPEVDVAFHVFRVLPYKTKLHIKTLQLDKKIGPV